MHSLVSISRSQLWAEALLLLLLLQLIDMSPLQQLSASGTSPSHKPSNDLCQIVRCSTILPSSKSIPPGATPNHTLVFCRPNHVTLIMLHTPTGLQDYNVLWNLESVLKTNMKRILQEDYFSIYVRGPYCEKAKAFQQTTSVIYLKKEPSPPHYWGIFMNACSVKERWRIYAICDPLRIPRADLNNVQLSRRGSWIFAVDNAPGVHLPVQLCWCVLCFLPFLITESSSACFVDAKSLGGWGWHNCLLRKWESFVLI